MRERIVILGIRVFQVYLVSFLIFLICINILDGLRADLRFAVVALMVGQCTAFVLILKSKLRSDVETPLFIDLLINCCCVLVFELSVVVGFFSTLAKGIPLYISSLASLCGKYCKRYVGLYTKILCILARLIRSVIVLLVSLKLSGVVDWETKEVLGFVLFLSIGSLVIATFTLFLVLKMRVRYGRVEMYLVWLFILEVYIFTVGLCGYFSAAELINDESTDSLNKSVYIGLIATTGMIVFTDIFKESIW